MGFGSIWGHFMYEVSGPEVVLLGILGGGGGGVPPGQILTVFQTKKCHFSQPFSDLSKIYSLIQTWPTDVDDIYVYQEN